MLGAVAGRVILMDVPWLPAGVLGLGTLFVLEAMFGELRKRSLGNRILNQAPLAVMVDGEPQDAALAKAHLAHDELMSALRQAGVRRLAEVRLAVFEPHGRISVLRVGDDIDSELLRARLLLSGVEAEEEIPLPLRDATAVIKAHRSRAKLVATGAQLRHEADDAAESAKAAEQLATA